MNTFPWSVSHSGCSLRVMLRRRGAWSCTENTLSRCCIAKAHNLATRFDFGAELAPHQKTQTQRITGFASVLLAVHASLAWLIAETKSDTPTRQTATQNRKKGAIQ